VNTEHNTLGYRPSLDEYFMEIAHVVATRSTCLRHSVGAVIVRDGQLLSTGYNGAPRGAAHCISTGCNKDFLDLPSGTSHDACAGVHAEQNAIIQGAYHGTTLSDSTLYCTHSPCYLCAKMIVNTGINRVVVARLYPDERSECVFKEVGIEFVHLNKDNLILLKDRLLQNESRPLSIDEKEAASDLMQRRE